MFDVLDSALFRLLNDYARNSVLDSVLPFFSLSWPFVLGIILFFSFFTLYCRKHYGDALWRLLALGIVLSLSVGVSGFGSFLMKDGFERYRPYQVLSGTVYYDTQHNEWFQIRISQSVNLTDSDMSPKNSSQENLLSPSNNTSIDKSSPYTTIDELGLQAVPKQSGSGELDPYSEIVVLRPVTAEPVNADINELKSDMDAPPVSAENMLFSLNAAADQYTQISPSSYQILDRNPIELEAMLEENGYAMPSAFAANIMAMALVMALLFHKASPWIYLMPLLVGWSRIYTGNSYPLDILVGWIWGIIAVAVAWLICEIVFRSVSKNRKL